MIPTLSVAFDGLDRAVWLLLRREVSLSRVSAALLLPIRSNAAIVATTAAALVVVLLLYRVVVGVRVNRRGSSSAAAVGLCCTELQACRGSLLLLVLVLPLGGYGKRDVRYRY